MSAFDGKILRENEPSLLTKGLGTLAAVGASVCVLYNIKNGTVSQPYAFSITLIGLLCFLIPKVSLIKKGRMISFGTKHMTENMANIYRLGYWLMIVGIIITFI